MVRVGIISASGYAGAELVRYLLGHPAVKITYLSSKTFAGQPLSNAYPSLLGQDLPLCEEYNVDAAAEKADILFQAHGNGIGMKLAPAVLERNKKFVDIPADFRLKDADVYKQYYGFDHTAQELLGEAVYGIPELHAAEIANARLVANPGCYATGAILALAPLVAERLVDVESIVIDSKSGVSGAGRSKVEVSSLFTEVNEGFKAYAVGRHRHTPEIEQELSALAGMRVRVTFTPHLVPMNRGILTTAYAKLLRDETSLVELYRDFYARKKFVVVLDEGAQPNTKNVFGTNYCHIGVVKDQRTGMAIITSAIDNMGKGAAGQAVQNMNLLCGFEEELGLTAPAVFP
ncbi:MAG: N-acetyl-gamma-glutamyl-phosphate reductase [Armatimonadota bacterium]|nr:N-acetyl-gamma-glutamyl-phosphate reductase [Armatimonadota bacterium]